MATKRWPHNLKPGRMFIREIATLITDRLGAMSAAELRSVDGAARRYDMTNCWCKEYDLREAITRFVSDELQFRLRSADSSTTPEA